MLTEEIATTHLKNKITCTQCHGPSNHHMHDEMLMTKPDRLFGRAEVAAMCQKCHADNLHSDKAKMDTFLKKWLGTDRPNGRAISKDSICTDCHGTHNIIKRIADKPDSQQQWLSLFNGKDLKDWKTTGNASWTVKRGRIVAKLGPKGKGGTIWTKDEYDDCLVSVTFRATWPIHAGIWLRAKDSKTGPRIEIFDNAKKHAYTGSVYVTEKGLALINLRKELVSYETWNTLSVKIEGDRCAVWLNGEEVRSSFLYFRGRCSQKWQIVVTSNNVQTQERHVSGVGSSRRGIPK